MYYFHTAIIFLIATSVAELGFSPWPRTFDVMITRANKDFVRKAREDEFCPESWMKKYLPSLMKNKLPVYEVFRAKELEDDFICEYAISSKDKAMIILDVDKSSASELHYCYRDLMIDNMNDKLGAKNVRTIMATDIVNDQVRDAFKADFSAVGKNVETNNFVEFKPGSKGWDKFYLNNQVVTGILNTLCTSGEKKNGQCEAEAFCCDFKAQREEPL